VLTVHCIVLCRWWCGTWVGRPHRETRNISQQWLWTTQTCLCMLLLVAKIISSSFLQKN